MSGFFEEPPQQPRRPAAAQAPPQGRSRALVGTAIILVAAFFLASVFTGIWTDRLWFRSIDYGSVFTTTILTKTSLFIAFGVVFAAVVERLVLPPSADGELPADDEAAREYAASHPDRQEVRIVAAATRDGAAYCTLRMRAHDDDQSVLEGVDLVPGLLELLHGTLTQ